LFLPQQSIHLTTTTVIHYNTNQNPFVLSLNFSGSFPS
jgi:hypothetical protein